MNAEQTVIAALRVAADVEPQPGGLDAITTGIARRRDRARLLVPVTAAATVLALVAGVGVLGLRDRADGVVPARSPRDLYVEQGSVWPFQSKAAARAWRRDPSGAPYLATPDGAAREFAATQLGGHRLGRTTLLGPDVAAYEVAGGPPIEIIVRKAPGSTGPWVVAAATSGPANAYPKNAEGRRISSPVVVYVSPITPTYRTAVLEPTGDGGYAVLGEQRITESTSNGIWEPSVDFRRPRGGFAVLATVGTDERGTVVRADFYPVSTSDRWNPMAQFERPDRSPQITVSASGRVVAGPRGGEHFEDPRGGPAATAAAAAGGPRFAVIARRTGPCSGRLTELVSSKGPERPLRDVAGLPTSVAARGDRIAYTVRRCDGTTTLVALLAGREVVVDSGPVGSPGWHPTEDRLVYLRGDRVVVAAADGSARTELPIRAEAVTWRPGEQPRIVAAVREPAGLVVTSYAADGGDPQPVTVPLPLPRVGNLDYDPGGHFLAVTGGAWAEVYKGAALLLNDDTDAQLSW